MTTAAIVLAAGLSSRMGAFKPLLPVGGTTAIARTVANIRASGAETVVVTGHRGGEVADAALAGADVRIAHNAAYETGMFSSVLCGLNALPRNADAFFLLPADCCAIDPESLRTLIATFDGEIAYPTHGGKRGHPPLIPARHIAGLLSHDGTNGANGYLKHQPSRAVEVSDAGILLDMDTPEDYAQLLKHLGIATFPTDHAAFLRSHGTPREIAEHGAHVASICAVIAAKLTADGVAVDLPLLLSSAHIHDFARAGDDHAAVGAEILLREGFPDAARLVRQHMEPPPNEVSAEEKILFTADKLCRRGELVMPDAQLARMRARFANNAAALAAAESRLTRCAALLAEFGLTEANFQ